MRLGKGLWISLVMAPVVAAFVAVPVASRAAEHEKKVKCEITKEGKVETKEVKNAEECTKMGGKVVSEQKKK
jgi:hypothetical protein